jgi:hypothetical protein
VSATDEAQAWTETVQALAKDRGLTYEPMGGINPVDGPVALCVGGTNRITGELVSGAWGAACDADEHEEGGLFSKAVLPGAVIVKSHMPDLADVLPAFNVESIERRADELVMQRVSQRKVEFESLDFNKRFLATVPSQSDPIALRELFSPGFLEWVTTITGEIDFGVSDRQLWTFWRLPERTRDQYEAALDAGGELFKRIRREMEEHDIQTYPPGPWYAGLEPFPAR